MKLEKKDMFLSKLLGYNCFNIVLKKKINKYENIKGNYLLILKTSEKLKLNEYKNFELAAESKLITFKKKLSTHKKLIFNCRFAEKKDLKKIIQICSQKQLGSRFEKDRFISRNFLSIYRSVWLTNFFKKKRGDYLIVAYKKKIILGFVLLIKEGDNLRIDQILVNNRYKKKGVAKTLIKFTDNFFFKRFKFILAGTYKHNIIANKMYKKLKFFKTNEYKNIYHLYPKKTNCTYTNE
jgi:ribosomal protein S18 acetylase RimI-like enzyme